ncbi:YqjF family protein [Natronolimnobius baerhuensis]
MTWRHGLFLHWPVDPAQLRPHVPAPLTLETWEGNAWVSVLPFVLTKIGIRGAPAVAQTAVAELNVRTYVSYRGDSGLFFFSIDLNNPLVAALAGPTRLPVTAANMRVSGSEDGIVFSSRREPEQSPTFTELTDPDTGWFAATYRPDGPVEPPEPGTFEHWSMERRRFYAPGERTVMVGEIAHDPWPVQPAEVTIQEQTMLEANGLPEPIGSPRAYYCDELPMTGSIPRWIRR